MIRSYERTGIAPAALLSRPDPGPDILFYLECFFSLNRLRPIGYSGPQPLSIPDILCYGDLVGFGAPTDRLWFLDMMAELDEVYRGHVDAAQKKRRQQDEAKNKLRGKR